MFGASLESVVKTQNLPSPPVPHLVLLCAAHIEEEGEEQRFRAQMKRRDLHTSIFQQNCKGGVPSIDQVLGKKEAPEFFNPSVPPTHPPLRSPHPLLVQRRGGHGGHRKAHEHL